MRVHVIGYLNRHSRMSLAPNCWLACWFPIAGSQAPAWEPAKARGNGSGRLRFACNPWCCHPLDSSMRLHRALAACGQQAAPPAASKSLKRAPACCFCRLLTPKNLPDKNDDHQQRPGRLHDRRQPPTRQAANARLQRQPPVAVNVPLAKEDPKSVPQHSAE